MPPRPWLRVVSLACLTAAIACQSDRPTSPGPIASRLTSLARRVDRVLLLSVDGFHALDLRNYLAAHPGSALAELSRTGTTFTNASTSRPSDSYPGLLAQVTGGSPKSTGVYYDDSYDRALSPPGSACATRGTEVVYDESIEFDNTRSDGGGGINPAALPLDPAHGCTPVYPHSFLRVNTIFEVIKQAGRRTAWSDKHLSYELVNGPSGHGVDDLFTPEITAVLPNGETGESNAADAEGYDAIKVAAILNEIDGLDHSGVAPVGVPAIFGMNFQAVSVGQKTAGYSDAAGTPTPALAGAFDFVDASIGRMVRELKARGLYRSTLIIVSAKHGQTPINRSLRRIIDNHLIPSLINGTTPGLVAQSTADDITLLWLTDQTKTAAAVATLAAHEAATGITSFVYGDALAALFDDPRTDTRTPDLIALPTPGVIYTSPTATKLAEHGGFNPEDLSVPILVAGPGLGAGEVATPVRTAQIAPTILAALGLDPAALDAVRREGTAPLPLDGGNR